MGCIEFPIGSVNETISLPAEKVAGSIGTLKVSSTLETCPRPAGTVGAADAITYGGSLKMVKMPLSAISVLPLLVEFHPDHVIRAVSERKGDSPCEIPVAHGVDSTGEGGVQDAAFVELDGGQILHVAAIEFDGLRRCRAPIAPRRQG